MSSIITKVPKHDLGPTANASGACPTDLAFILHKKHIMTSSFHENRNRGETILLAARTEGYGQGHKKSHVHIIVPCSL
jgi:hypothetical protein